MIIRARKRHYQEIVDLMQACKSEPIPLEAINSEEISLIAVRRKQVIGFLWASPIAGGTSALITNICVEPAHQSKGVAKELTKRLIRVLKAKGIPKMITYLSLNDPDFDIVGVHAAKSGFVGDQGECLRVHASVDKSAQLLGVTNA